MAKLDRLSLLKFLSEPRFIHEVAEHYRISKRLANFHLREAIKSGQVLISEKPISQILNNLNRKPKRSNEFVYIFQKSPMLIDGSVRSALRESGSSISDSKGEVSSIKFVSKTRDALEKTMLNHKVSDFSFEDTGASRKIVRRLKTKSPLTSEFDFSSAKTKLTKHKTFEQLLEKRAQLNQKKSQSISYVEKIRFFQALLKNPLTFLDIHGRFGVSKQTIRRLTKNGLVAEFWGPKDIGVRFKLTNKGKTYLEELEAAARYEPKIRETSFIRLKHRSSF